MSEEDTKEEIEWDESLEDDEVDWDEDNPENEP